MKWRTVVWILRIAVILAIVYWVWCTAAYFVGKHSFRRGMTDLAQSPTAAMRRFEIAVRLQPGNARYRAALGRAALKAERFPEAAEVPRGRVQRSRRGR